MSDWKYEMNKGFNSSLLPKNMRDVNNERYA
jgi:hypothetical protein